MKKVGFFKEPQYSTYIYSNQICLRNKIVFWHSYSTLNIHKYAVSLLIKYLFTVTEIQQQLNKSFFSLNVKINLYD